MYDYESQNTFICECFINFCWYSNFLPNFIFEDKAHFYLILFSNTEVQLHQVWHDSMKKTHFKHN